MAETRTVFYAPLEDVEWRQAEGGRSSEYTVAGHAAVFNRLSLGLGGFRERIAPGAFTRVLDSQPDVHLLWDHNTSLFLARTQNKTLDLREDPMGLHFWARVADTSYSRDLKTLMERRDIDQASFAFTTPADMSGEEWEDDEELGIVRTILPNGVDGLYDATITARGAYPQTDSGLRTLKKAIEDSRVKGLTLERAYSLSADLDAELHRTNTTQIVMPQGVTDSLRSADEVADNAAPEAEVVPGADENAEVAVVEGEASPQGDLVEAEERDAAPSEVAVATSEVDLVAELQASTRARRDEAAESYRRLLKEEGLA